MNKFFLRFFNKSVDSEVKKPCPLIVTFTGGMGAQIISAAIYFSAREAGRDVFADFSYFAKPEKRAEVGKIGECSQWAWQLSPLGLTPESFRMAPKKYTKKNADILHDGPRKLTLGLNALASSTVRSLFEISNDQSDILPANFREGYLCIHVRRGDYVNVASHVILDGEFENLAKKFSGLVRHVAVISDSPLSHSFRDTVSSIFRSVSFQDNTDAFTAHRIMRGSRILICSNSQFSLIAAALNPSALVLIPKQWFSGKDRNIEGPLHSRCSFQILEHFI